MDYTMGTYRRDGSAQWDERGSAPVRGKEVREEKKRLRHQLICLRRTRCVAEWIIVAMCVYITGLVGTMDIQGESLSGQAPALAAGITVILLCAAIHTGAWQVEKRIKK